MWKEEACLAKVATTLSLLHNVTWFSQRKVAPLLTCEECEAQTCNLILNLNFLAVAAGSHWRKYTSTTSQISSDWAAARWEEEGQRVHSKSSTHVIEASGGPKDSLNIACPLSVSHCISISFTGEQDLQPIKWHLVLTLAENTQYHLVMEKEQWPGLVLVMWWWQCWWVPRYPSTGHTQPTGWHTGPSAEAAPPTHPRTITHPPTVLRLVTLAPHITLGSISSWSYIWYSFLISWIYLQSNLNRSNLFSLSSTSLLDLIPYNIRGWRACTLQLWSVLIDCTDLMAPPALSSSSQ